MLSCEFYEVFKNIYERVLLRFLWCFLESFFAAGYLSLMVMMVVIMMMMILFKFDIESFKTIFKNTFFTKSLRWLLLKPGTRRHGRCQQKSTEIINRHQSYSLSRKGLHQWCFMRIGVVFQKLVF